MSHFDFNLLFGSLFVCILGLWFFFWWAFLLFRADSFWAFFWKPISCKTAFIFFCSKPSVSSARERLPRWTLPRRDISMVFLLPSLRAAATLETSEARRLISWIWVSVTARLPDWHCYQVSLTCGLIRSCTACVDPLRDWGWLLMSSGISSSVLSPEGNIIFNSDLVNSSYDKLGVLRNAEIWKIIKMCLLILH